MLKISSYLVIIFYSLMLLPIWGMGMIERTNSNNFSIFIVLLYTIISLYYIKQTKFYTNNRVAKILIYTGPIIYFISILFIVPCNTLLWCHPIVWACSLFVLSHLFADNLDIRLLFFSTFLCYFYGFIIHPYWVENYKSKTPPKPLIEEKDLSSNISLRNFQFINQQNDTLSIDVKTDYVLIETWNESCLPCIKAMQDLQPIFEKNKVKLTHYFLYESPTANHELSATEVFNYKHIKNKQEILIDLNNQLYDQTGMQSFPYFLLFNKKGELVDYFKGYDSFYKGYFEKRISGMAEGKNTSYDN